MTLKRKVSVIFEHYTVCTTEQKKAKSLMIISYLKGTLTINNVVTNSCRIEVFFIAYLNFLKCSMGLRGGQIIKDSGGRITESKI